MTAYAATMAYPCPCGEIPHIFLECDEDPLLVAVSCWSCGEAIGLASVSPCGPHPLLKFACRLRLSGWEASLRQVPRNTGHTLRVAQVWRVL
jgi:hypothetical protein